MQKQMLYRTSHTAINNKKEIITLSLCICSVHG